MEQNVAYIWLGIIILAGIVEGATVQLVSIWFVLGGVGALAANLLGAPQWLQIVVFAAVSTASLLATRPLVRKLLNFKKEDTNAGRYIGETGLVIAEINNILGKGQVNVRGSIWTARSEDDSIIKEGENVKILSIQGVKMIVSSEHK
jgi:membrane protein implicated in regulation of membrane protease activity